MKALAHRVEHLRLHHAPPNTPLHTVYMSGCIRHICSSDITSALCTAATLVSDDTGILPSDIYAHGLRAGGAMALLCAHVDSDIICLVGRW